MCSLSVEVTDGRIISVDAAPVESSANPHTAGYICKKVKGHAERVHGPDRVMTPLIRTGAKGTGTFREASWEEAFDLIAGRMKAAIDGPHGAASIVPYLYNSSTGHSAADSTGPAFFARIGASDVQHTICAAIVSAAWQSVLGGMPKGDPIDVEFSDCVVVWGANPTVSNTHLPPIINRAVKGNGAPLIVVDPRVTGMAKRADLHLAIRPGTDVVLAMSITTELERLGALDHDFIGAHTNGFDAFLVTCGRWSMSAAAGECGVEVDAIRRFVDVLVGAERPFFRLGWGMERNRNGGSGIQTALGLRLALGRFGERGSAMVGSSGGGRVWKSHAFQSGEPLARRPFNQNLLGQMLCDSRTETPVEVLFVQGANPALMNPNQAAVLRGLAREDLFTVVHDQVLTDTARWADVVLPATTHFETSDARGSYGFHLLLRWDAVIEPIGQSRSNAAVFAGLASRFGFSEDEFPTDPAVLLARGLGDRVDGPIRQPGTSNQFSDLWPDFEDRRAQFIVPTYSPVVSVAFPLTLLSPASPRAINSMFGERPFTPVVHLHPDDALARGVVDRAMVRVFNERGSVVVPACVDGEARRGVVVVPKGEWSRNYPAADGFTINVLMTDAIDPLAGGACFNDTLVDVVPV